MPTSREPIGLRPEYGQARRVGGPETRAACRNGIPARAADYNQKVRNLSALALAVLALAGCQRSAASKDAVRQAVIDYVAGRGLSVAAMNIDVTAVNFTGSHAEANVSFTPKNAPGAGMAMIYVLDQQGAKWVVTGRKQAGGAPHGGGAMPGAANPHGAMPPGGMANPHGAGGAMPSPQDLPPVDKSKK